MTGSIRIENSAIQNWLFHVPNTVLALAMYMLLGRLVLSIFFSAESQNMIWRVFCRLTDPIVRAVSLVTPKAVPPPVLLAFAFLWVLIIRRAFGLIMTHGALVPPQSLVG